MIPSCIEAKRRRWRRCFDFSRIRFCLQVLAEFTLSSFEWNGHFYLFVTNGSFGNVDNNLQLFVSENLRGPYRAHPENPIKLGLRGSRMAGPLFLHGDALYRPAQDCKPRYGAQVVLYRVDLLSPDDFRETEAAILPPDAASPYGLASHTVVWYEGLFATDGIRADTHRNREQEMKKSEDPG